MPSPEPRAPMSIILTGLRRYRLLTVVSAGPKLPGVPLPRWPPSYAAGPDCSTILRGPGGMRRSPFRIRADSQGRSRTPQKPQSNCPLRGSPARVDHAGWSTCWRSAPTFAPFNGGSVMRRRRPRRAASGWREPRATSLLDLLPRPETASRTDRGQRHRIDTKGPPFSGAVQSPDSGSGSTYAPKRRTPSSRASPALPLSAGTKV